MRVLNAPILYGIATPPIENGYLILDADDRVVSLTESLPEGAPEPERYEGALVPGFINTHCHLELSHLKGLIAPGWGLDAFIRNINGLYKKEFSKELRLEAMKAAEEEMLQSGIVGAGDICSGRSSLEIKKEARLAWYSFCEAYGSFPGDAEERFRNALGLCLEIRALKGQAGASVTPHSTYSASPGLFGLIKEWAESADSRLSLHHQENSDENDYFMYRKGAIVARMQDFGVDIRSFRKAGAKPLMALLHVLPSSRPFVFVHNTVSENDDIAFAMQYFREPYWCLCPGSNLYIENTLPNLPLFRKSGAVICLGTDSLASNTSLSILQEMKHLITYFPGLSLEEMLKWACLNGAKALGMDGWAGSFEPGKRPGVVLIESQGQDPRQLHADSSPRLLVKGGMG